MQKTDTNKTKKMMSVRTISLFILFSFRSTYSLNKGSGNSSDQFKELLLVEEQRDSKHSREIQR